jgi:CRP/FNR family transcriptional regulator
MKRNRKMYEKLRESFHYIFEEELLKEIELYGTFAKYESNQTIIDVNQRIEFMPLLLEGAIKIMREDEDGDELLLYYLERGDTCAMTLTCCMGNSRSEIRAITEDYTELFFVPIQKMDEWITKYKSWRNFVFESYNTRLKEMLASIDSLAFKNLDDRLEKYLSDKVKISGNLEIDYTHQHIAEELNSSRVVISRLLKKLEKQGKIEILRNKIRMTTF